MPAQMSYSEDRPWQIEQLGFDDLLLGKSEAIMALGNGYLGTRSAEEESYAAEQRDTFVAGAFNVFHPSEVTELPNAADMWAMQFLVDGTALDLGKGAVTGYSKRLDLRTGELTREFEWQFEHRRVRFAFRRFVSKARRHLMASTMTVQNLGAGDLEFRVRVGIDGRHANNGSQHFTEGEKGLVDGEYLQMMPQTTQSGITFVHTLRDRVDAAEVTSTVHIERRQFFRRHAFALAAGATATIERRASIYTSLDNDLASHEVADMRAVAVDELRALEGRGFDELLAESAQAWAADVWDIHPITIESDDHRDQLAVRFAQYHLHTMTPAHDERMNIGAKGLTGQGYKGHTFWDTEMFMLPYFTFAHPPIAKSLVNYRYLGLEGAHKKAADGGYRGARYPWEAAWPSDGEVTPVWGAVDIVTGEATKIWAGFIKHHLTSDVAFAVKTYIDVTGDVAWAQARGFEILLDTARYWPSRLEWHEGRGRYELTDVVGPDEYQEHVDNNAYTNYGAHWNMTAAIGLIDDVLPQHPEVQARLDAKFDLAALRAELVEKSSRIYLPQPTADGIIAQDDTYLQSRDIDLTKYKSRETVASLFQDYNLEQVQDLQVTKQADVLLLLLWHEGLFGPELKLRNFDYYEPRTTHDSSLSLSTHAILSADLGKLDEAYEFFVKARDIDMGEYMRSSDDGVHAASLGGIWQMVVLGFGGVRMIEGRLRIEPHLPAGWSRLVFGFDYHGHAIAVEVDGEGFTLTKADDGEAVSFSSRGREYELTGSLRIPFGPPAVS
ncbi:MAG: hypothetical protein FWD85_03550 [Microbacteriaceae bacterium]|nr:hypothetical protein [Microbacteriaceae bacterium]